MNLSWALISSSASIFSFILGLALGLFISWQIKEEKRRKRSIQMQLRKNNIDIRYYKKMRAEYQNKLTKTPQKTFLEQKIKDCEQTIDLLNEENIKLKKGHSFKPSINSSHFHSLLHLLKTDPVKTNLTKSDWDLIFTFTDELFNKFLTYLITHYFITRHEQEICCLIKWGFSRKEQIQIFNNTSAAMTKSRGRLKKRLLLNEKENLEHYLRLLIP
ncbi:MAG: hypothetical protein M0P33_10745 [Massilibacteroides sp.]|nr:hypothetical protein [Massilibacteroides sp.]